MKDFDFDEIDKAVAGALANDTQDSTAAPSIPVASMPDPVPAPAVEEAPAPVSAVVAEPTPEPKQESEEVVAPRAAPAARRSSGRFMDVVHPSSDMRGRTSFTPPTPQNSPVTNTSPEPVIEETPRSSQEQELEDWAKPLESPFLPDAKVEKRPLGGVATSIDVPLEDLLLDEPDEPRLSAPDEPRLEAPDEPRLEATTIPDPIDFAAHANELSSEKEDTGIEEQPVSEPVAGEVVPVDAPVENSLHAELAAALEEDLPAQEVSAPVEEPVSVESATVQEQPEVKEEPIGPTSITQQYTEQPSSAEAPGAIYDTEAYHQPVAAPPKKKSGIWVVLWIFLLIVLGAVAGVIFYLFVLPLL